MSNLIRCLLPVFVAATALLAVPAANAAPLVSFATPVVTGPSQAPGVWYTDRYAPAGFTSPVSAFGRTTTLQHSISGADLQANAFNNTQGRKYDLPGGTTGLFVDLYVPSAWDSLDQTGGRLASLWATAFNASNAISAYPIIEFNNDIDGFRIWNGTGWDNVDGFDGYDQWYQIGFELDGADFTYYVNGTPVFTTSANGSTNLGNVILQGVNSGNDYDIHWDNLTSTPIPEPGSMALFGLALAGGAGYWWRRRKD